MDSTRVSHILFHYNYQETMAQIGGTVATKSTNSNALLLQIEEIWETTHEDTRYEVSTLGRVRTKSTGEYRALSGNAPNDNKTKYYKVSFPGGTYSVARLVLYAHVGPPPSPEHTADHINRNTLDNRLLNLRWASRVEQRANQINAEGSRGEGVSSEPGPTAEIRDIPGYPGYRASSDGLIQLKKRKNGNPTWRKETADIRGGYYRIDMGVHKRIDIHFLVALAFLGPKPANHSIRHINGIRTDNRASNLQYFTGGSVAYSYATGARVAPNQKAVNQYNLDGKFVAKYPNQQAAANAVGRKQCTLISKSTNAPKKTKTAYGFYWVAVDKDSGEEDNEGDIEEETEEENESDEGEEVGKEKEAGSSKLKPLQT